MANSINTDEGLAHLARIVKGARGNKSFRRFARESGLSQSTIKRIEDCAIASPSDSTFEGLARATGRTFEDLKAIARQQPLGEARIVRNAEDVMPLVNQLPDSEAARLAQMIVAKLARTDVVLDVEPTDVPELSNAQIGELLKAIANKLSGS